MNRLDSNILHDTNYPLELRFAFDGILSDVLRSHFESDAQSAKLSAKFKLYYLLRPYIPIVLRQILQRTRNQKLAVSDRWYIQGPFISEWKAALEKHTQVALMDPVIHPWPYKKRVAISLTHDIETGEGIQRIPALADLEESLGIRSAWFFVPHKYKIDHGLLRDLKQRGHEIGVHGFNHDGRLFASKSIFDYRTPYINKAVEEFGATGFRAPMVHRNLEWMQQIDVDYDASCFDVDPFQAMPGGVGGVWPFIVGKLVELPYTLPQDHTLFLTLGETTPRIWIEKFQFIRSLSGMAMLVTHPDYLDTNQRINVYRQFLEHVQQQMDGWLASPSDIAKWWRMRDASCIESDGSISGPASEFGRSVRLPNLFTDHIETETDCLRNVNSASVGRGQHHCSRNQV